MSEKKMILVVDDDPDFADSVSTLLKRSGFDSDVAVDGVEGVDKAKELKPDAIVLDVMMPEMSGWEVLQRLRNHPKTARLPVIICSVFNNPELAFSLGASFFLPKPIGREDVLSALRSLGIG